MMSFIRNKQYMILLATALFLTVLLITAPLFHNILTQLLNVTSYIVWHNIFEFSSIIISICIFCVTYYSFEQNQNLRYLFLGSTLLLMGFVDFFHVMSYKGMPDFLIPYTSSNRATTFWIIARLIGGLGILITSITPIKFKLKFNKVFFILLPLLFSFFILNLVTYSPESIPTMYIEGKGLTETKISLEIIVILFILSAILFLLHEYSKSKDKYLIILSCALLTGIYSELSFTLYTDVYGIYNFLGHLLKFVMYFIIFRVIFIQNIKQPYFELSIAKDEIKNYADNLDKKVEQRTEQIKQINKNLLDDLEYARRIQISMLPKTLPDSVDTKFQACYFPADRISGDFYNVFKIDDTKIGIYIGDVSGHGVSAAMLTVFLNQSIKITKEDTSGIKKALLPSEVLTNLYLDFNKTNFNSEVYIVLLYCIFDLSSRELTYASAGLNVSPMVVSTSGKVSELVIKGFPICKFPNNYYIKYSDSVVTLNQGDKILFHTDGLIEAEDPNKETYSALRLKTQLLNHYDLNAFQLAETIKENLFDFIGDSKIKDDITFLIMETK